MGIVSLIKSNIMEEYFEKYYNMGLNRYAPKLFHLMKLEDKIKGSSPCIDMWNEYCGKDVLLIRNRDAKPSVMDKWKKANEDLFLGSIIEDMDARYTDLYFKAIKNKEYQIALIAFDD